MKVSCQACGAKYTIADDKVQGRRVKVRCKSCRAPIVVDGSQPGEPETESAGSVDANAEPMGMSVPPGSDAWEVNLSDTEQRSMTTAELEQGWRDGTVTSDAFVWKEGMDDWKPVLEIPELKARLGEPVVTSAPAASPVASTTAAPQVAPQAAAPAVANSATKSSPGAATAAAPATAAPAPSPAFPAPPATKSAPLPRASSVRAPSAGGRKPAGTADLFSAPEPTQDEAALPPTGARNENSVLFSLDALKSVGPAKPEAPKRSAPKKSGLDDIMNLGGGSSPLFLDNQALLTAPAPPEPKPAPVAATPTLSASTATSSPAPKAGSKKLLLAGGAAVALLAIVGVVLAMSGGKEETKAEAEPAASSEAPVAAKKVEDAPKPEEKPPEPVAEAKPAEPEPAASASAAASAAPAAAPATDAKPAAAAGGKTAAAKPAGKEDKPAAPAAPAGEFNKSAAIAALNSAAGAAASCKKAGGPTGSGKVVVTFAPSGRVTSANVQGGSFGGTPVGGCVASKFRSAKIPPFSGSSVTVSKSFSIN